MSKMDVVRMEVVRMKTVECVHDMKLAEGVVNQFGVTVLQEGEETTERVKEALLCMGVYEVAVLKSNQ